MIFPIDAIYVSSDLMKEFKNMILFLSCISCHAVTFVGTENYSVIIFKYDYCQGLKTKRKFLVKCKISSSDLSVTICLFFYFFVHSYWPKITK